MSGSKTPSSAEYVLDMLPDVTLKDGFMAVKSHSYILVLTDVRIIFVREQTSALRKLSAQLSAAAKAAGKGRKAQFEAGMSAYDVLAQQYEGMSPAAILAKDTDNFAIERSKIIKIKLKSNVGDTLEDRLTIKTKKKSYKMVLNHGMKPVKRAFTRAGIL
ncbi:MAG: hypothetical protein R2686_04155 [Candidatus Nanopelagicales bacterium]